jgi:hypothetical protein
MSRICNARIASKCGDSALPAVSERFQGRSVNDPSLRIDGLYASRKKGCRPVTIDTSARVASRREAYLAQADPGIRPRLRLSLQWVAGMLVGICTTRPPSSVSERRRYRNAGSHLDEGDVAAGVVVETGDKAAVRKRGLLAASRGACKCGISRCHSEARPKGERAARDGLPIISPVIRTGPMCCCACVAAGSTRMPRPCSTKYRFW